MKLEPTATRAVTDGTKVAVRGAEGLVRKLWSIMDAASQKKSPTEFLSTQAIRSIQGKYPH